MGDNGQSLITVLILVFFSMILPAIILLSDEKRWVKEVEKEQREHDIPGSLGHT